MSSRQQKDRAHEKILSDSLNDTEAIIQQALSFQNTSAARQHHAAERQDISDTMQFSQVSPQKEEVESVQMMSQDDGLAESAFEESKGTIKQEQQRQNASVNDIRLSSYPQHEEQSDCDQSLNLTQRSERLQTKLRYQVLTPHPYQLEIYTKIKRNWANDTKSYGNVVYLETGTGKTYIAIMLLKYLFSSRFIDYRARLREAGLSPETMRTDQHLDPIELEDEKKEEIRLYSYPDSEIDKRRTSRHEEIKKFTGQDMADLSTVNEVLKKQKKVVFITPTQNLVEQQAATIEAYTELCVGRYHGGQKQNHYYSSPKMWRNELAEQDVLIFIANKFYDLLMHGFMHMEEVDLLIFDECHHADQDHPYNLIMRDFWYHEFDPENPLKVKRPKVLGLTASPIKQKIERNKVQATEIEIMLQNLSNNLYARFITFSPKEIQKLEKDNLQIELSSYDSKFDQNLEAVQQIEHGLIRELAKLVRLPSEIYTKTDYQGSGSSFGDNYSRVFNNLDKSRDTEEIIGGIMQKEVYQEFKEEQDSQVLKFLNGRKHMITLNNDFTKQNLSISNFESYEDKILVIFCIIIIKNINNLLLEIGPLAVKAFFRDLKRDLLQNKGKDRKKFGLKSEQAIKVIDQFCYGPLNNFETSSQAQSMICDSNISHQVDSGEFRISEKIQKLINTLNESYKENNSIKTIIFVKDRSVAVYLKKLLAGDEKVENESDAQSTFASQQSESSWQSAANVDESMMTMESSGEFIKQGMLDRNKFRIGFAMGFKSKNVVNKAYKSLNTEKVSMIHDVLGGLPSVKAVKLTQNQLKDTLSKFREGELNVLIATNVVEEGLDVSTCNQVICLNELLTVKAFIQMKGRARQENSKFIFICAKEETKTFNQNKVMFESVINFMKKITTKTGRNEIVPEHHVLHLRQQQQEEFYEVPSTKAKVTAKQAKLLIEKFCTDFIEKSIPYEGAKKQNKDKDASNASASVDSSFDSRSNLSSISASLNSSKISSASTEDNHHQYKPNYVVKEAMKEGAKFFYCILYFPIRCKEIIDIRKQNPLKAHAKKRDAESHVALEAVKRLQTKKFLTEYLMTNYQNEAIKAHIPEPPQSKSARYDMQSASRASNITNDFNNTSMASNQAFPQVNRSKTVTQEDRRNNQEKHRSFVKMKKQDYFEAPPNQINIQKFEKPLSSLFVHVFRGKDEDSEYPYRNSHDFLGILFDRKFSNPSMQFLMYQEQRAKNKNAEHLNNMCRKNLLIKARQDNIEQKEEELRIAIKDCFQVRFPGMKPRGDFYEGYLTDEWREQFMAAKLQCYHMWLFYYLYSADYKFLKAIFKLKFAFVKVLFRKDFEIIFGNGRHDFTRKREALDLLEALYLPKSESHSSQVNQSLSRQNQHNGPNGRKKKDKQYMKAFEHYLKNMYTEEQVQVPLLAYTVPVTNRARSRKPLGKFETNMGRDEDQESEPGMRIDWATVDKVVDWVRSRLYELSMPTERTYTLQKFTIDDPVRHFTSMKMLEYQKRLAAESESAKDGCVEQEEIGAQIAEWAHKYYDDTWSRGASSERKRRRTQLVNWIREGRGEQDLLEKFVGWASNLWNNHPGNRDGKLIQADYLNWMQQVQQDGLRFEGEQTVVIDLAQLVDYGLVHQVRSQDEDGVVTFDDFKQVLKPLLHKFLELVRLYKLLEKDIKQISRSYLTGRLWDQKFQGNRFVILDQVLIHDSQDKPIDLNQSKKDFSQELNESKNSLQRWFHQRKEYKKFNVHAKSFVTNQSYYSSFDKSFDINQQSSYYVPHDNSHYMISSSFNNTSMMINDSRFNLQKEKKQQESFKTREFYFLKQGIFEHRTFSKYIIKCRKERHFQDFGKKKRDEEEDLQNCGNLSTITKKMIKQKGYNNAKQLLQRQIQASAAAPKRTNTVFDVLDQLLTKAPVSYVQYQVLQTTCYHMLNFNELLMTEKFIKTVFKGLMCPLTRQDDGQLVPADASKEILMTYLQIEEREKMQGNSDVLFTPVTDQLLLSIETVKEALTQPGACREYDYERLEFYGDSIIGFLVILELYLTQQTDAEGDLDFKRIEKVSNLRFYNVNKENRFYQYMITESHQVYSGYDHAGLDDCNCSNTRQSTKQCASCKIKQKHQNELYNKLSQLKLIKKRIEYLKPEKDALEQIFMRGNVYQLAEMIVKDDKLYSQFVNSDNDVSLINESTVQDQSMDKSQLHKMTKHEKDINMCKLLMDGSILGGPRQCLLANIEEVIKKVEKQIEESGKSKRGSDRRRQKGPFYYKQLADVVESVTGAVTLACGLNCTQDYLRKIGVLEYDQSHLMGEMEKLVQIQQQKSQVLDRDFYEQRKFSEVEDKLGYEFKCKAWLIEALTHKSFSREHEKKIQYLDDYERLEFLGDAVLGFLMARYFFQDTQDAKERKNPKELHKMKTSVINNNLLSLIVIENGIHNYMIYNEKAPSFHEQFQKYVSTVTEMQQQFGTTEQLYQQKMEGNDAEQVHKEFDLDLLHEHNLKIFGDVFESIIGAVFLDSQSVEETWEVLERLIKPYVKIYADLTTLQDHSRTLLLEMWNQKPYTKNLTCKHETEELENGDKSCLKGIIIDSYRHRKVVVYEETFTKDAKSKVRTFYKHFYQLVKKFVDEIDQLDEHEQKAYQEYPKRVTDELEELWRIQQQEDAKNALKSQQMLSEIDDMSQTSNLNQSSVTHQQHESLSQIDGPPDAELSKQDLGDLRRFEDSNLDKINKLDDDRSGQNLQAEDDY